MERYKEVNIKHFMIYKRGQVSYSEILNVDNLYDNSKWVLGT